MKYIDIHSHLDFVAYDSDREDVIKRAREAGVGIISVGVDLASSIRSVELAERHDDIWAMVGLHPTNTAESIADKNETGAHADQIRPAQTFDHEAFIKLARHPKVVGIGECGLDYFHSRPEDVDLQRKVFIEHIKLANEVGKPLMLHVRDGKAMATSAYLEALSILREHAKVPFNLHFFAGSEDDLDQAMEAGATFSFTGVVTFSKDYDGLVKRLPLERIMSETDSPYVSPAPFRGKRNEPIRVIEVVKSIARIRGEDEEMVAAKLLKNAQRMFLGMLHRNQ